MLFCFQAKTQPNLVYNGDFELYSSCPIEFSSHLFLPFEIEKCLGWAAPTFGTSDYFNVCAPSGNVDIPNNFFGVQNPYSGNGYCGLYAFMVVDPSGCLGDRLWWEYIQGQFIQPLLAGHTYSIGFWVSLADNSAMGVQQLGLYISNTAVNNACRPAPLLYVPQIYNTSNTFLTDTTNWFLISGEYTALGGEKYITIGNFKDSLNTNILNIFPGTVFTKSYYYIDQVSAYDITLPCNNENPIIPNVFTPNNDSVNDILYFKTCDNILKTTIYNRWGNIVFATDKVNYFWDGRKNSGEECVDGNYFYVIETEKKYYKGFIQLIR